jgi:hypothetical protein
MSTAVMPIRQFGGIRFMICIQHGAALIALRVRLSHTPTGIRWWLSCPPHTRLAICPMRHPCHLLFRGRSNALFPRIPADGEQLPVTAIGRGVYPSDLACGAGNRRGGSGRLQHRSYCGHHGLLVPRALSERREDGDGWGMRTTGRPGRRHARATGTATDNFASAAAGFAVGPCRAE